MMGFLVFGVGSTSFAQSNNPNFNTNQQDNKCDRANLAAICADTTGESSGAKFQRCMEEKSSRCFGNNGGDPCQQAKQQFDTAYKEFTTSCGKANMSVGGSCMAQAQRCLDCLGGGATSGATDCGEADVYSADSDVKVSVDTQNQVRANLAIGSSGWGKISSPNFEKLRVKYGSCPPLAGGDYKSLQKEVEDGQKKVDDAEKRILKIKEDMDKIRSDFAEEVSKLKEKDKEAEKEWQKKRNEIDKKFFKENEEVMNQLSKLRSQKDNYQNEIDASALKKNDEKIKRDQALSALRLKCNEIALTQIQQQRSIDLERIKQNSKSAGGFNSMMSQAGMSQREQYQKKAKDNYEACLASNIYKEGEQNIQQSYTQALKIIDNAIAKINKAIAATDIEVKRIMEVNLPQKKLEYAQDIKEADDERTQTRNTLEEKRQTAETKAFNALQSKIKENEQAEAQLKREQTYLEQKQKLLSLKNQYSDGDGDLKSSAVGEAMANYDNAVNALSSAKGICCGGGNEAMCSALKKHEENFERASKRDGKNDPADVKAGDR